MGKIEQALKNAVQFCELCASLTVYVKPRTVEWEMGKLFHDASPYTGAWESEDALGAAMDNLCETSKESPCWDCGFDPSTAGKQTPYNETSTG